MDKREMIKLSPSMVHQGSLQLINREYPFWDTLDKKKTSDGRAAGMQLGRANSGYVISFAGKAALTGSDSPGKRLSELKGAGAHLPGGGMRQRADICRLFRSAAGIQ